MKNTVAKTISTIKKHDLFERVLQISAFVTFVLGALLSLLFFASLIARGYNFDVQEDFFTISGQVGDFVGGVAGTLWALTGVLIFYLALRLQKRELSLHIDQLRDTKHVFQLQSFENTFLRFLEHQNYIIDKLQWQYYFIDTEAPVKPGKEAPLKHSEHFNGLRALTHMNKMMKHLYNYYVRANTEEEKEAYWNAIPEFYFKQMLTSRNISEHINKLTTEREKTDLIFALVYERYNDQLNNCFLHLFSILNFLENKEELIKELGSDVNDYTDLLKAQLTGSELFIMFYFCVHDEETRELAERYNLFEYLSLADLIDPAHAEFVKSNLKKNILKTTQK